MSFPKYTWSQFLEVKAKARVSPNMKRSVPSGFKLTRSGCLPYEIGFLLNTLWLTYFGVYGLGTDDNLSSGVSTPLVVPSNQDRHHEGRSGLKTRQTPAQSGREKGDRQTTQGEPHSDLER